MQFFFLAIWYQNQLIQPQITSKKCWKENHNFAETNITINESNVTNILQCPATFDDLLCWSRTDAPGTATLPCPPASIMGYTDLASENLRALAVASKVCLENGQWYQNADGVFWSNYSLCVLNRTRYMINGAERLNYPRWYETEYSLLNVSFFLFFFFLVIYVHSLIS